MENQPEAVIRHIVEKQGKDNKDSISLKRSTKGTYSWEISVKFDAGEEQAAKGRLDSLDTQLKATYLEKKIEENITLEPVKTEVE
jgi:putative lipoic acid-binding regulatory protein